MNPRPADYESDLINSSNFDLNLLSTLNQIVNYLTSTLNYANIPLKLFTGAYRLLTDFGGVMSKITKKYLDGLKAEHTDLVVWDDQLKGFGVRVKPSGRKSFIIQYRNANGRSRRLTIGLYGRLTPDQARREATQLLAGTERGDDPVEADRARRKILTFFQFAERYLTDHAEVKKKARSVYEDRRHLESFILPALGKRPITDITRQDIIKLHHSLRQTPYQANRTLALVSKMMNLAEKWGLRPDGSNPCRHVEKFKEKRRERYLSEAELSHLGEVLEAVERDGSELPSVVTAIRLLIFTGCRLNEILTLKWTDIDQERGLIVLNDSKTGGRLVPLNLPAVEALERAPRLVGNPYVCPGVKEGGHLVGIRRPWDRIKAMAEIKDCRLHDLRHSFASVAASSGMGLPIIGGLLGHTQASTTQRYAHLANDPLRQASDEVGKRIKEAMNRKVERKIIPFRQKF